MIHVYCFSATGRSWAVAQEAARALGTEVRGMDQRVPCGTAVVVFPVYCQNLPPMVREFLPRLEAGKVALLAVYGGISPGNVLAEAQQLVRGRVIAGAALATGHTYLKEPAVVDRAALAAFLDQMREGKEIRLSPRPKVWYADLVPAWRSRRGVKLTRTRACTQCGLCVSRCPMGAMGEKGPGRRCIRCLRCAHICPRGGLTFRLGRVMKKYLARYR